MFAGHTGWAQRPARAAESGNHIMPTLPPFRAGPKCTARSLTVVPRTLPFAEAHCHRVQQSAASCRHQRGRGRTGGSVGLHGPGAVVMPNSPCWCQRRLLRRARQPWRQVRRCGRPAGQFTSSESAQSSSHPLAY